MVIRLENRQFYWLFKRVRVDNQNKKLGNGEPAETKLFSEKRSSVYPKKDKTISIFNGDIPHPVCWYLYCNCSIGEQRRIGS